MWLRATLACALFNAPPRRTLGGGRHGTKCQGCLALCSPEPGAVAQQEETVARRAWRPQP